MMKNHKNKAKYIPFFILLFAGAFFAFGYIVMGLWNWLIPSLFSGPVITFWQAIGIMVLTKILFGGFRRGNHRCHRSPKHFGDWKERYREKYHHDLNDDTNEVKNEE